MSALAAQRTLTVEPRPSVVGRKTFRRTVGRCRKMGRLAGSEVGESLKFVTKYCWNQHQALVPYPGGGAEHSRQGLALFRFGIEAEAVGALGHGTIVPRGGGSCSTTGHSSSAPPRQGYASVSAGSAASLPYPTSFLFALACTIIWSKVAAPPNSSECHRPNHHGPTPQRDRCAFRPPTHPPGPHRTPARQACRSGRLPP